MQLLNTLQMHDLAGQVGCHTAGNYCVPPSEGSEYPPSVCCPALAKLLSQHVCTNDTYTSLLLSMETGSFPVPLNCMSNLLCTNSTDSTVESTPRGGQQACGGFLSYTSTSGSLSIKLDSSPGEARKCSFLIMPNWYYSNQENQTISGPQSGNSTSDHNCVEDAWGSNCSTPCNMLDKCLGNGRCNEFGRCECYPGFTGSDCSLEDSGNGSGIIRPALAPVIPSFSAAVTFMDPWGFPVCRGARVGKSWVLTTAGCCDVIDSRPAYDIRLPSGESTRVMR